LKTWNAGKYVQDSEDLLLNWLEKFPESEKYLLTSQLKRASRSITNNLAEGYGRFHFKENAQFCRQSRGSLYEVKDHLIIALDENYITRQEFDEAIIQYEKCILLLNGYISYLIKADKSK